MKDVELDDVSLLNPERAGPTASGAEQTVPRPQCSAAQQSISSPSALESQARGQPGPEALSISAFRSFSPLPIIVIAQLFGTSLWFGGTLLSPTATQFLSQ